MKRRTNWLRGKIVPALAAALIVSRASVALAAPSASELQKQIDSLQRQLNAVVDAQKQSSADASKALTAAVAPSSEQSKFKVYGDFQFRYDGLSSKFPEQNSMWQLQQNFPAALTAMKDYYQNAAVAALTAAGKPTGIAEVQAKAGELMQGTPTSALQQMLGQYMHMNAHKAHNYNVMTNRVRLNIETKAAEEVEFKGRLNMYKLWGMESADPLSGSGLLFPMKSDAFAFDAGPGHTPSDNVVRVDRAYVNWNQPGDLPIWLSVGRRPTTGGAPEHLRAGYEFGELQATPIAQAIDYAFDGATLGVFLKDDWYPFQGGKFRFCYGKGFESGFDDSPRLNSLNDALFYGVSWDVINDKDSKTFANFQSFRADGLPDSLSINNATSNVGNIQSTSFLFMQQTSGVDWFFSTAWTYADAEAFTNSMAGMLDPATLAFMQSKGINMEVSMLTNPGEKLDSHNGASIWAGARIPLSESFKLGLEYNYGSKYWVSFSPSTDDDLWSAKQATRGHVGEIYGLWYLPVKLIGDHSKAFFRFGYQYYKFNFTGSGSYLGAPIKVSDLSQPGVATLMASPSHMHEWYASFNVFF